MKRKVFLFENAEDRDQTLMFFSVTAIIIGILWFFKTSLEPSIEHILMLFVGAFTTLLNFHHKRKNGNGNEADSSATVTPPPQPQTPPTDDKVAKELERIKNAR